MIEIKIRDTSLNLTKCLATVASDDCGGTAIFVGTARNETDGRKVLRLEFEAYTTMALKEMEKIALQAVEKWPIKSLLIHHRNGVVAAGEPAIIIIATAIRRDAAFQACRYTIDILKETVPIWKKEIFEDGAEWVSPHP